MHFLCSFSFPFGAILQNAQLVLGVEGLVLFSQKVLVKVIHLDAMHLGSRILTGQAQVYSMVPEDDDHCPLQASKDISMLVTCKDPASQLEELFSCDGSTAVILRLVRLA